MPRWNGDCTTPGTHRPSITALTAATALYYLHCLSILSSQHHSRAQKMTPSVPSNFAAWLIAEKAYPLEVKPAEYTRASDNEIVVKTAAIALNPVDRARQAMGSALFPWTKYPTILGSDVAGEVVEIGPGAERFKIGDRVLGLANGLGSNRSAEGAFQKYVVLAAHMAAPIPSSLSYESAAVIPLGISTAACGLFEKDALAFDFPTVPARPSNGETVLIWGGSTSVGSNAIQLAVAAGYEVITTASPKNFEYVKKLGASRAFDYSSHTVVADIVRAFKGKKSAGAFAIGFTAPAPCIEIVNQIANGKKFVALANQGPKEVPKDIQTKFVFGSTLKDNEVGPAIYIDYLPKALANGKYIAAPKPEVVGQGIEEFQQGLDALKNPVSAKKLVISL
jgi:NADPH:quinone reductase-like Zn-dependent oxidoreductase